MSSPLIQSIIGFLLAIGILASVHEFGHFWVARRLGIKVLKFSIGFGPVLLRWHDRLGTEYLISLLPFGGYVKMLDGREATVSPLELPHSFNHKPIWARMAVILAGPFFNFLFAIIAYWWMFMIGIAVMVPILGTVPKHSAAGFAGFKSQEEIIKVNDETVNSWEAVVVALMNQVGSRQNTVKVQVKSFSDPSLHPQIYTRTLDISHLADGQNSKELLWDLGLTYFDPSPPIIGGLLPGQPADMAGLQVGDLILSINHVEMKSRSEVANLVRLEPGKALHLKVKRHDETLDFTLTPILKVLEDGLTVGFMGVEFLPQELPSRFLRLQQFGVLKAFQEACRRTGEYTVLTVQLLKRMVVGSISLRYIGGPIAIAQQAGHSVNQGFTHFLSFLAMISLSLGVLNLLPIPMLDGGQFMYCVIEAIRGRPISERHATIGFWIGAIFLVGFMSLAVYNDLTRW